MENEAKHRSIRYINDLKKIDSSIDIKEAISVEERLGEEARKSQLMCVIVIASICIALAILVLIYLKSFERSALDDETILVLASGTVIAIIGYMGVIVKYYWKSLLSQRLDYE